MEGFGNEFTKNMVVPALLFFLPLRATWGVFGKKWLTKTAVLWKHAQLEHGGRTDVNFKMTVLKTYGKNHHERKLNEALALRISGNPGISLNSKAEYCQPSLPRLVVERNRNR